jgi:hypothetical protein
MNSMQTDRDCVARPRNFDFARILLTAVTIWTVGPTLVQAETYPAEYATLFAGVEQTLSSSDANKSSSGTLTAMLRENK